MAIRTFSQVVQNMIDRLKLVQPALDSKVGTVTRDIVIDNPADQVAQVYRDLKTFQQTQSLLNAVGKTLDLFGSNYGIQRDQGHRAAGNAILTFNNLLNNINIASGTTITAKTGVVFRITANIIISAATKGIYSSFAKSISTQLNIAGISDSFAVQVPIEALNVGANGNVPTYSLIKTSISGISNVTNIAPITGGTNPQNDAQYRNQILAGLSGSSAGTARGYKNALLTVPGVQSVFIAEPGNPILTRDGTVTERNSDGSLFVVSPGTGGKVDIWTQGTDFINISEAYVFHDLSGTGDITSPLNAHILGQTSDTSNLTALERRNLFTQTGELPLQPVDSLISINGSVSGANFVQGVNYELVKDTSEQTENTAFALDKLTFLRNFISLDGENVAKGSTNSVETLTFKGVKSVDQVHQSIIVTNDLATLDPTDHTKVAISHKPLDTTLRVTNLTSGERYVITNQNIDSTTGLNEDGTVFISGSVLPSSQDLVQVDYVWDYTFDTNVDYFSPGNKQFTTTGIDWGRSNYIEQEQALLIRNGNRYNLGVSRNLDRVQNAFYCDTETATVQQALLTTQTGAVKALRQVAITTGSGPVVYFVIPGIDLIALGVTKGDILQIFSDTATINRSTPPNPNYVVAHVIDATVLQIQPTAPALVIETGNATIQITRNATTILGPTAITGLQTTAENIPALENVVSVKSTTTGLELFNTESGGTFSGNIIYLATDVPQPDVGEEVIVLFNSHEVFNIAKNNGAISTNNIILSTDDVLDFNSVLQPLNDIFNGVSVKPILVNYIATEIDVVATTAISQMPFIGSASTSYLVDVNNLLLTSRQPTEFDTSNQIVRSGPSYLTCIVSGAFGSGGTIAVKGTGWFRIDTTMPILQTNINGKFDLADTIVAQIGTVSNEYSVAKVSSISINDGVTDTKLAIRGYEINDNTYDTSVAVSNSALSATSLDLSAIFEQNTITSLSVGSTMTITFYVLAPDVAETIQFTTGRGTLYSRYKYARVDRADLISGFVNNSTITGNLRIARLSQPAAGSSYLANYSYFAPVEGERLTITYRYNNIIQDATSAIEEVRTLTADVLVRLALQIQVNVAMTIILTTQAVNQSSQVIDQVTSAVGSLITNLPLGSTLDYSALLRVATAVSGVSGADVTQLDFVGSDFDGLANRKSITADPNQYFVVNTINIAPGTH